MRRNLPHIVGGLHHPTAAASGVLWGCCPDAAAGVGENWSDSIAKYPDISSNRSFTSGAGGPATGTAVGSLATLPNNIWSNKPALPGSKDTYNIPTINLPPGCDTVYWCPWHEVDGKVAQGVITLSDYHDLMDRILSQTLPTGVELGIIVTAWGISQASGGGHRQWTDYWHDGVTWWGSDFDGLNPGVATNSYPSTVYQSTLNEMDEIRTAHPGTKFHVPEWGTICADGREDVEQGGFMPTWDPAGNYRAQWLLDWAENFRDFGMDTVELFDFTNGHELTYAVEFDAWEEIRANP